MAEEFSVGTRVQIMPNVLRFHEYEKGTVCQCMCCTVVVDLGYCEANVSREWLRKIYDDRIHEDSIVRVRRCSSSKFAGKIGTIDTLYGGSAYVDFGNASGASIDRDELEVIGKKI